MTDDDLALQKEILDLRQEYARTKATPPPELIDAMLRALALREDEVLSWRAIADKLNSEGYRTERGKLWSGANVWNRLRIAGLYFEIVPKEAYRAKALRQHRDGHGRFAKKED